MPPRSVLLYSDGPIYAGAERYLVELARGLIRQDWYVTMACSEEGAVDGLAQEARSMGIGVDRLPAIPTLSARGPLLKVFRYFATKRRDILHFNLADPRACNGAMTAARMAFRSNFVVTEHLPTSRFDQGAVPLRHRMALRNTAATIVNTPAGMKAIQNRPENQGTVHVIPNGIDDPGGPTPERRRVARAALGYGPDDLVVGWVGRFAAQKVPGLMVEGIRMLTQAAPHVRFVMIGDGPEFHATESLVHKHEVGHVTRFTGFRKDARELLYGLDLLVNTSNYEGMPFTILEAMFAGVPTVATRIPGNEDLVAHLASGLLFTPRDGHALNEALHTAVGDRDRLHRFGLVARERAVALHSLRSMCERTGQVYEQLLER